MESGRPLALITLLKIADRFQPTRLFSFVKSGTKRDRCDQKGVVLLDFRQFLNIPVSSYDETTLCAFMRLGNRLKKKSLTVDA